MLSYDPDQPLVSLHVPKTAGSSLRLALQGWFPGERLVLHYKDPVTDALPVRRTLEGPICVHGHFDAAGGTGIDTYYPQTRQFITFLRDPFEQAVSFYCYMHARPRPFPWRYLGGERRMAAEPDAVGFDAWIAFLQRERAAGRVSDCLLHLPAAPSLAALKQDLADRFVLVGLTETFGRSLAALAVALGKPARREPRVNRTDRLGMDFSRWRAAHEHAFPEDYEVYEAAVALNAEALRRYGPPANGRLHRGFRFARLIAGASRPRQTR